MSQDIDITQPRECIYQEFEGRAAPCPRCGAPLVQSTQAYLVTTRQGNQIADSFIISNDMGWFCESCPTVVINAQELADMFQHSKPGWNMGNDYAVVGILDLDAVPPSQRSVPFDELDPLPLIQFSNWGSAAPLPASVAPLEMALPKPTGPRKTSQFQSTWSEAQSPRRKRKRR